MKKLIFLLITVTFITVSFLSIKQFEYFQFQTFNKGSKEQLDVIIKAGNPQKNNSENFLLLEKIALEEKVNLQRVSYEKDKNNKDKVVYYVVFSDSKEYFKQLKLKSGKFLDSNSSSKDFLSTVQTNNMNQIGQLLLFHSFDPIEIRPMSAAEKAKDIKGTYILTGVERVDNFKKSASKNGFSIKITKERSEALITHYPYQEMILQGSLILCLLIMLALFYDVGNNYKEIAVRYMFGNSFWDIGVYLFKKYINILISSLTTVTLGLILFLYFYNQHQQLVEFLSFWLKNTTNIIMVLSLIFIITWIGTKRINIPQMIKNKKPIKLFFCLNIGVRFIVAIFLLIGLQKEISTFKELRNTVSKEEKWAILKDYSYLGVIANLGQEEYTEIHYDQEKRKKFQLLYKDLESQGALYVSPSPYYMNFSPNTSKNSNPWGMEGRKIEINNNYLSINPIRDVYNNQVKALDANKGELTVLVPIKYKKNENDIKNSVESDYRGIYNIKEKKPVNINIIYVKNNQSYFTYSPNMAQNNNNEIVDPIAVIINNNFDPSILANTLSMGYGYYTKNSDSEYPFEGIKNSLKEYGLDGIWQPVSVAYSIVELTIAHNIEELQITTIYCGLFLILVIVLLFFSSIYYLEMNKQSLALQWIFGYNFFEKHYIFYLSILVFWNLTFMVTFFINDDTDLLAKITLGLAFLDLLISSILLSFKEFNVTKQVLIEK